MVPNTALIDREQERAELVGLLRRGKPVLALLTGRRRVGKTYLLANAWAPEELFLYTAAQTTPELNRRQFLYDLAAWSGQEVRPEDYPTWRTVFRLLVETADRRAHGDPPRPTVVVLDEFQYLADGDAGVAEVASELNAVWEQLGSRGTPAPPLLLMLSGSAVATMEALAGGGAPLYGRFAWHQKLQPFTYWHAAEFAPFRSLRDRALLYGIFGGTPRYLSTVDPARRLALNAADLLLSPRGEVRLLVETALDQEEGLRDVPKYRGILRAVADGCTERNEVAQRAGLGNDHALREKLAMLVDLGYLEQRRNIEAKPNEPVRYFIADPAFRFYHRFVAPNASVLERYPAANVWATAVEPYLGPYMGLEFERIVTQAYDRRALALDLPMVNEWGRWEGVDRTRRPLEIDIVAPLADGRTMTGSVKWDAAPVSPAVHHAHLEALRRAADAGRRWAFAALEPGAPLFYVAAGGFTDAFREQAASSEHPLLLWTLEDIYATDTPHEG